MSPALYGVVGFAVVAGVIYALWRRTQDDDDYDDGGGYEYCEYWEEEYWEES